jgi:D-arabinose 1-dehydrogenase-like Zn-dependent alcohol dehydrogenase
MRAIVLHEPGPPEHLRLEERERPTPGPGEALVRVRAAGVCYRDCIDRRGGFPFMKRPVVPGHELAGEVVAVGDGVEIAPGSRVVNVHRAPCGACRYCNAGEEPRCERSSAMFGLTIDGAYAEHVLAPAGSLVPLPAEIEHAQGCFLACTAGVALRALERHAKLRPGETVLVTGASGGVGLHALGVARALGAHTIAVTSSEAKAAELTRRGADEVVCSPALDFHKEVRARTGGGVDVVLDCVGTPTLNASVRSARPLGRVVVAGNVTTERFALNPGWIILSEVSIAGTSGCSRADLTRVLAWVAEGRLTPALAERLPLERAADAHRMLEEKAVTGRLVLEP